MDFAEERRAILRLVKEGRLEPEEADTLLRALERAAAEPGPNDARGAEVGKDARSDAGAEAEPGPRARPGRGARPGEGGRGIPTREEVEQWLDGLAERLQGLGEKLEGVRERIGEAIAGARSRMEQAGEEGRDECDKAWEAIQRAVGQVLDDISHRLGARGGAGSFIRMDWDPHKGFAGHRVERSLPVPDLAPGATVRIRTRNGSVTVQGTDGPPTLLVRWRVRAESEEAARQRAESLLVAEGDERGWTLETREERGERADVRLALPRRHRLSLEAETTNGKIAVQKLALEDLRLHTHNGAVDLEGVTAGAADIETGNGEVRIEDFVGGTLHCRASNGSVRVRAAARKARLTSLNGAIELEPAVGEGASSAAGGGAPDATVQDAVPRERSYELETTNGRVRVAVPASEQVGYRFDLETLEGRIVLALEDIRNVFHEAPGRGGLRAETFRFEERPERVDIRVRSRNGSIAVEAGGL